MTGDGTIKRWGRVTPPWWDDKTVYVIGGGESAGNVDFERLRRTPDSVIIACNDSAVRLPWSHALASIDRKWMTERQEFIRSFAGEPYMIAMDSRPYPDLPNAIFLRGVSGNKFSTRDSECANAGNTGHAALNIAVLKQARRIVLVGFDMEGGHWHGGYRWNPRNVQGERYWRKWSLAFEEAAPILSRKGITVINASEISHITCFPKDARAVPLKGDVQP